MTRTAVTVLSRAVRAVLAGALALAWVLAAGPPAAAVDAWSITDPGPGATVTGPRTISVSATANPLQTVEMVEVRFLRAGGQVGPFRGTGHAAGPRSGGTSTWTTSVDPLRSWAAGGQAMANGIYTLQSRVAWTGPRGRQETGWAGHDVIIDAPPPPTNVSLRLIDTGARSVEVAWQQVELPDFVRYIVQRAPSGGGWSDIAVLGTSSTTRFVDAAPGPGTWRYRVAVTRVGGTGGERRTDSAERAVEIGEPGQPDPTNPIAEPTEPGGTPTPDPGATPGPDGDGSGDGDGGDGAGGDGTGGDGSDGGETAGGDSSAAPAPRSSGSLSTGGATSPRVRTNVPRMRSSDDAPQVASAQPPAVSAADDDTFSETLPYAEPTDEPTEDHRPVRRGDALEEGSALAIYDRELQLEEVLPPVAGGLLLFVVAGHVLRLSRS